jgi:hypothetical protein
MNMKSKQAGLSPAGVLVFVVLIALVALVGIKLAPFYMDYSTVRTVFQDTAQSPEAQNLSLKRLQSLVSKRLLINSVRDFDIKESLYMDKSDAETVIGFEYEVREHIVANIDVILTFEFEVPVAMK